MTCPRAYRELDREDELDDMDKHEKKVARKFLRQRCTVCFDAQIGEEGEKHADFIINCGNGDCVAVIEVKSGKNSTRKAKEQIQSTLNQMSEENCLPTNLDNLQVAVYAPKGLKDWKANDPPTVRIRGRVLTIQKAGTVSGLPCCE